MKPIEVDPTAVSQMVWVPKLFYDNVQSAIARIREREAAATKAAINAACSEILPTLRSQLEQAARDNE